MPISNLGYIAGAILPTNPDEPQYDFAWLDGIDEDNCYMPIDTQRPSKSYDFGEDGYTGSVTTWHELLQFTAPDEKGGIVFVRGDFPDGANSVLARAQRRNQKGTFGLGVDVANYSHMTTVLEQTQAHGMINMRWPCTRLNYVQNDERGLPTIVADYTACSFLKDHTLYQIVRISPRVLSSPGSLENGEEPLAVVDIKVNVGGLLRFGCSRSTLAADDGPRWPLRDNYEEVEPPYDEPSYTLACLSRRYAKKLEIRMWINRDPVDVRQNRCHCDINKRLIHPTGGTDFGFNDEIFPLHAKCPLKIAQKAITIVASFSLVAGDQKTQFGPLPVIPNMEVQNHLGVSDSSVSAPYKLWAYILQHAPGVEAVELNAMGRCAEAILNISAVPVSEENSESCEGEQPGVSEGQQSPGCSHESCFSETRPVRCIALIKNIISGQFVDFESMFWQVRYLVKILKYLDRRHIPVKHHPPTPAAEFKEEHDINMFKAYKTKLSKTLEGICRWMLAIIPFLKASTSKDLAMGILPCDIHHDLPPTPVEQPNGNHHMSVSRDGPARQEERRTFGRSLQRIKMRSQKWYCAFIIWYLLCEMPERCQPRDMKEQLWETVKYLDAFQNKDNRTDTAILDDSYGCILRWYHSHSVWKICQMLEAEDPARFTRLGINLEKHKELSDHWQIKAEKSLRLFGQGRFMRQILGHEVAYLALVGTEIDVDEGPRIELGPSYTCLEYAKKLIDDRPETSILNPGGSHVARWDAHDVRSAVSRPAPWELSCLGHHVSLSLDLEGNREEWMQSCWQFLLSDYLFLGSLDPNKTTMVCQWWDLTTSSIICAKLLDEAEYLLQRRNSWTPPDSPSDPAHTLPSALRKSPQSELSDVRAVKPGGSGGPKAMPPEREKAAKGTPFQKSVHFPVPRKKRPSLYKERKSPTYVPVQDKEISQYAEGFTWTRRLPAILFHPDTSVQSLDDTPNLFGLKQNKKVYLRREIKKYLGDRWLSNPQWTLRNIKGILTSPMLRHFSCVDFLVGVDANGAPEIVMSLKKGRIQCADKEFWSAIRRRDNQTFLEFFKTHGDTGLLDLYFLGKPDKHPKFSAFPGEFQEMLRDESVREKFLQDYQESLLSVLNDSLVDLGTRYRVVFARDFNPATLRAMVYMWHPDALDTFDSHLGTLSVFSDTTQQVPRGGEDLWISTITLSHWRLQSSWESELHEIESNAFQGQQDAKCKSKKWLCFWPTGGTEDSGARANDPAASNAAAPAMEAGLARDETDFPPRNVSDKREIKAKDDPQNQLSKIRSLSVSLVMTGDWGRYWTCTVLSELIDEAMAEKYAGEIREILQMFIHQHYTGRVLVFLLLLGYLCESLAIECENFIEQLDRIMGMDTMVLLKGMPWSKSDVALKKLKRMLWGLEALRVFSDKLARAINEIQRAHEKMLTSLLVGYDIRHSDMTRERERVVEDFEKRQDRLRNAHSSIQQRIEQGSRLREGITSVIGVEQNENVSMLTWVTIAYLPLAFVAGLFSMDHLIVPLHAGWHTFGWLTVAFVLGTVLFALSLQTLIAWSRHVPDRVHVETAALTRWAAAAEERVASIFTAPSGGGGGGVARFRRRGRDAMPADEETGRVGYG